MDENKDSLYVVNWAEEYEEDTAYVHIDPHFAAIEKLLSNRSFIHRRSFSKDVSREMIVMNENHKQKLETDFNGLLFDTCANRT